MDRRKRSAAAQPLGNDMTTELSPDILFHQILPRLPAKSVRRFRCVSKQWQSFLRTPLFFRMHNSHVLAHKMVVFSATTKLFHTIDCERPDEGFSAGRPLPFEVGPRERLRFLTSAHGLVCIGIAKFRSMPPDRHVYFDDGKTVYSDLILWNPTTGDHKTLSTPVRDFRKDCYNTKGSLFGLYHSSRDDDYKLLRINHYFRVYIYSLKSDSWRKVWSKAHRSTTTGIFWGPSVSLNGNLYFLGQDTRDLSYSVMRFNTKTELVKLIATPIFGNGETRTTWLSFTVDHDDGIRLWMNIENKISLSSENQLWRMDGDGDGDGNWTKVVNTNSIISDDDTFGFRYHHRVHLMRNGNLLIHREGCVYELDMKTNNKVLRSVTDQNMLIWPGGKYIETSVSP